MIQSNCLEDPTIILDPVQIFWTVTTSSSSYNKKEQPGA